MTLMTDAARKQAISLANALDAAANDADSLHFDMHERGRWGTGVTAPLARELRERADSLRSLVREAVRDEQRRGVR